MRTSIVFSLLLGILATTTMPCGLLYSQTAKVDLDQVLEKAKVDYRSRLDEVEIKLIQALELRIDTSRKLGDKKAIDRVQVERDKFEADGTLPTSVEKASQTFQRQTDAARKKLELVYRSQIKEYVRRSEDAKAEVVQKELDDFLAGKLPEFSPRELLLNGGCEDELEVKKNSPWVAMQGEWKRYLLEQIPPQAGKTYFWPTRSPLGELVQEVDLKEFAIPIDRRQLKFEFAGYVRTYASTTNDSSRIILEFLDEKKEKALATFDSGEIINIREWQKVSHSRIAMKGTRWVRVRLLSKRYDGTENNSYYDSLSLRLVSASGGQDTKPVK